MDLAQAYDETVREETEVPEQDLSAASAKLEQLGVLPLPPGIHARSSVTTNQGEYNLVKVVVEEALRRRELDAEFLAEVRRTFAEPGQTFDLAFKALCSAQRVIVLRSRPDSGTRTAAVAMIDRLASGGTGDSHVQPHYLRVGGPTGLPTAALAASKEQAYLMDLSVHGEESNLTSDFGLELKAVSQTLIDADSYLIVIADPAQWDRIGRYATKTVVHDLEAPHPVEVARKWLQDGVPDHDFTKWFDDQRIADLLDAATPREAVEVAQLIRTAVSGDFKPLPDPADLSPSPAGGDADFQLRVRSVVSTRAQWRSQLLDWHKTPGRTAFERNFLLATAVLRGLPVASAYRETKSLCKTLGEDFQGVRGHSGPGVIELLDTIQADTAHDRSVRFPRQRWGEAVLAYFWQDRPDYHDAFITWLIGLPQREASFPTEEARAAVAERVSEVVFDLIMTPERLGQLGDVIDLWTADEVSTTAAWSFLGAASLHPRLGRDVAQMMLRWSRGQSIERRRAVAAVCAGEFGRLSTDKALVRLSHLIESREPKVVAEAERAVVALWQQPSVGREILEQLVKWESDGVATHTEAGRNIFSKVAGLSSPIDPSRPDLLVRAMASEEDLDLVAKGWRCLLDSEMAVDALVLALRPWCEAAQRAPEVAADVVSVFKRATVDSRRAHGHLRNCLYIWRGASRIADESPAGRFVAEVARLGEPSPDASAQTDPGEEDFTE